MLFAAYECYLGFLRREAESGKYPAYKSFGMAYIRFAKEERELFKLLFMCDRRGKEFKFTSDFDESVEMIMKANGLDKEKAKLMHLEMWVSVHGIATILATSFLELDTNLISDMLTDIYLGIRARHLSKEDENGESESVSVINQRDYIKEFAEKRSLRFRRSDLFSP